MGIGEESARSLVDMTLLAKSLRRLGIDVLYFQKIRLHLRKRASLLYP